MIPNLFICYWHPFVYQRAGRTMKKHLDGAFTPGAVSLVGELVRLPDRLVS